jgi:hypothetical protein
LECDRPAIAKTTPLSPSQNSQTIALALQEQPKRSLQKGDLLDCFGWLGWGEARDARVEQEWAIGYRFVEGLPFNATLKALTRIGAILGPSTNGFILSMVG